MTPSVDADAMANCKI